MADQRLRRVGVIAVRVERLVTRVTTSGAQAGAVFLIGERVFEVVVQPVGLIGCRPADALALVVVVPAAYGPSRSTQESGPGDSSLSRVLGDGSFSRRIAEASFDFGISPLLPSFARQQA